MAFALKQGGSVLGCFSEVTEPLSEQDSSGWLCPKPQVTTSFSGVILWSVLPGIDSCPGLDCRTLVLGQYLLMGGKYLGQFNH